MKLICEIEYVVHVDLYFLLLLKCNSFSFLVPMNYFTSISIYWYILISITLYVFMTHYELNRAFFFCLLPFITNKKEISIKSLFYITVGLINHLLNIIKRPI